MNISICMYAMESIDTLYIYYVHSLIPAAYSLHTAFIIGVLLAGVRSCFLARPFINNSVW